MVVIFRKRKLLENRKRKKENAFSEMLRFRKKLYGGVEIE
jgi:hypothetical protein